MFRFNFHGDAVDVDDIQVDHQQVILSFRLDEFFLIPNYRCQFVSFSRKVLKNLVAKSLYPMSLENIFLNLLSSTTLNSSFEISRMRQKKWTENSWLPTKIAMLFHQFTKVRNIIAFPFENYFEFSSSLLLIRWFEGLGMHIRFTVLSQFQGRQFWKQDCSWLRLWLRIARNFCWHERSESCSFPRLCKCLLITFCKMKMFPWKASVW